jgi:hypothetical protein
MSSCEDDPGFAALDAHICTQLAMAAESFGSHVDLDARLRAILETGTTNDQGDTALWQS